MTHLNSLLDHIPDYPHLEISGLCSDSRQVKEGDLFIAHAGSLEFRPRFIQQAISRGAVAVLQDAPTTSAYVQLQRNVPIFSIPNLKAQVGPIAARFYGNPTDGMQVIGVTGTNGKTSCSQFIALALQHAGSHCGVIGTLGYGFPDTMHPSFLTTPDAITLQRLLAELKQQNAHSVAMEVSSHGLTQHRVAGVQFDIAIFTNLTRDHLDYHGDMEHYGQAKRQLFLHPGLSAAVINADDAFGLQLLDEFSSKLPCFAYTTQEVVVSRADTVSATHIKLSHHGFSARITTPWGSGVLKSSLLGRFNLSNLLAVLTTLGIMQIPFTDILQYLSSLSTIPGRMQPFGGNKRPLVVVDYSHTPDSLEKALIALREHCSGTLWCVFGCGGNRDAGKRPLMGQIAERYSDQLIITADNPRFEDQQRITDDIISGLLCPWAAEIEHDRQTAIAYAINSAHAGDIVLIAGKGHECYQQIGAEKLPFNDAEQVVKHLALRGG